MMRVIERLVETMEALIFSTHVHGQRPAPRSGVGHRKR